MRSVRTRVALAVTAVAAIVTALVGAAVVALLSRSIDGALADDLRADSSRLVDRLTSTGGSLGTMSAELFQVVTPEGNVVEASGLAPVTPLLNDEALAEALDGPVWRRELAVNQDVDVRVLAVPVARPDGPVIAIVGTSIEEEGNLIEDVVRLLIGGGVLLVVAVGWGAWWLAGAALAPVAALRRQVVTLSSRDPIPRLDVPSTGDEVAALAGSMNALLTRLQRVLERERSLVADAGHELRTPLAILQGELELAGRPGRSPEEVREAVAAAAEEAERLAKVADSLLFLAADRPPDEREEVDLASVVTAAAGRARAHGDKRVEVQVEIDGGAEPLVVHGEPDSLRRAVENLVDNAMGHAPPGTDVVIRAARQADHAVVEVLDEGPGFPDSFLPFAFERFRRADEARDRKDGGAGLGLSIVQSVAEAHGGTATVANRAGGGAVARILLPT